MPRNAEVVRQWKILLHIEASRRTTIARLAEMCGVTTRTIRRDLAALQEAGFPLYDERAEGRVFWKLMGHPFHVLSEMGFTLSELSAFYFSRAIVEAIAGAPFSAGLKSGFDKIASVLTPRMKLFLDKLPAILVAKPEPGKPRTAGAEPQTVAKLVDATLEHRQVKMTYHSFSSGRVKDYLVEPYRLAYGQGALYLSAFVPEYGQIRTFAVPRIKKLSVLEDHFSPVAVLPDKPFANSIGIHSGKPEHVEIDFSRSVAPYIRERDWHASQKIRDGRDGTITLSLEVSIDRALESWVLSFGPFARVVKPSRLAKRILEEIEEARGQYIPRIPFEPEEALRDPGVQPAFQWGAGFVAGGVGS